MLMANAAGMRSTCSRAQVGAIVAIDSRPLVSGYNGTPAGMSHCDHTCTCATTHPVEFSWDPDGHANNCMAKGGCTRSVHAEANAIAFAARNGVMLQGATMYVTLSPCYPCAQLIINAGIIEVVYASVYRDESGIALLNAAGVRAWYQKE